jgi:3-oxoacyl-[acyl-carrier-protein] synthase III
MFDILDIRVALPERLQTIEDASEELFLSSKDRRMYARFFGLETFPRDSGQTLNAMMGHACAKLAEATGFTKEDLDLVIYCHTLMSIGPIHQDMVLPFAMFTTDRNEAFSVTMNHCATAVSVLEMIDLLLPETGVSLVIIGDKGFHPVLREIKNTTIMGESAVAMLVSRSVGKFRHVVTHTERRCRYAVMTGLIGAAEELGFAKEYVGFVADCIAKTLHRAKLKIEQIKLVLPHNVNLPSWEQISESAGALSDQIYLKNVPRYGHTFNADPYLNLVDAALEGQLQTGDYILLVSVGLGATASSAILQVNDTAQKISAYPAKETICV